MSEFFVTYLSFLAKTITLFIFIVLLVGSIVSITSRDKRKIKNRIYIKNLNEKYETMAKTLKSETLSKKLYKQSLRHEKKLKKIDSDTARKRVFVINFEGDIQASAVVALREEITAILTVATPEDEVLINLESAGGVVHTYGLAASQLVRLKEHKIPLTVLIDKVAASGGYLMACVADKVIAAPFAIIGSIGVIAQIPNFNRLLKRNYIDFEQISAGNFKRTLTLFGENTDAARNKFQSEVEHVHLLFKNFVHQYRPTVDIQAVSTGEHWLATEAIDHKLVDTLQTSDDYLLKVSEQADLYQVSYDYKKGLSEKFSGFIRSMMKQAALIS